jgi:hypothetical protein
MKMLIGAIIVMVVAIAIGYPLLNEGPSLMCDALEKRVIAALESRESGNQAQTAFLVALQRVLSNGSLAMSIVKQQHPDLPPVVGCTLAYWQTVLDPAGAEERMIEQVKRATAADDAQRAIERATDAQKAMRALSSPVAPQPAKSGQEQAPAFKAGDRREMDRLIENTR